MADVFELQTNTNLFGEEISDVAVIDREPLAAALYAQLKDISLDTFVSYLTNEFEAVIDYANLYAGERTGQRISLLYNPHRLDTGTKRFPVSLYQALKDERFVRGLARVVLYNRSKGVTKDLLYQSVGMGIQGTSYLQEFPPHVARDLALEYNLTKHSRVLDPCAGWGGRMLGFSTVVNSYTCCEPSQRTAAGLRKLLTFIQAFRGGFNATINEAPFEDVELPIAHFDFALTSPPYYDTEWYAPGEVKNSHNRYPTYDSWVKGFYAPLIHRTMRALKPGASFVLNIGSRLYPLNDSLYAVAGAHYKVQKQKGRLQASSGLGKTSSEGEAFYEIINPGHLIIVPDNETLEPAVMQPTPTPTYQPTPATNVLDFIFNQQVEDVPPVVDVPYCPPYEPEPEIEPEIEEPPQHWPTEEPLPTSLAMFLGTTPPKRETEWVRQNPPSLAGIHNIIVNFECNGLDWRNGHEPVGVTIGTLDGSMKRYLPFAHRAGSEENFDPEAIRRYLQTEVVGKHITNSHTKFDIHMGNVFGVDFEAQGNTVADVQHDAALLDDHRRRFALDVLATDMLGGVEIDRVDERMMADFTPSDAGPRAEYQATLVSKLHEVMWPQLVEQDLLRVRELENDVIYPVCEMERNGSLLDMDLNEQYHRQCIEERGRLLMEVSREAGFVFDGSNSAWQRLFERFNLPLKYLSSKKASFNEDVIGRMTHPIVQKAHLAGQYASLDSKTFAAYKKNAVNGVLYYDINQLRGDEGGTVTGRFSFAYLQQTPNADNHGEVFGDALFPRRIFIPREGSYLAPDAMQIEYRIFSSYAANPRVLAAYAADPLTSFHKLTHGLLLPFKPNLVYTSLKRTNFMILYGGGYEKTGVVPGYITPDEAEEIRAMKTKMTDPRLEEVRQIRKVYDAVLPEVDSLLKKAAHLAQRECNQYCRKSRKSRELHNKYEHQGHVRTISGRRARFLNDYGLHKALNRVCQGGGADVMKRKIVELHKERKRTGFLMRMTLHDQVGGDARDDESVRMVLEILNQQSFAFKIPILWEGKPGKTWADSH